MTFDTVQFCPPPPPPTLIPRTTTTHTHIQRLRADLDDREARLRAQEEEMQQRNAGIQKTYGRAKKMSGPVTGTTGLIIALE